MKIGCSLFRDARCRGQASVRQFHISKAPLMNRIFTAVSCIAQLAICNSLTIGSSLVEIVATALAFFQKVIISAKIWHLSLCKVSHTDIAVTLKCPLLLTEGVETAIVMVDCRHICTTNPGSIWRQQLFLLLAATNISSILGHSFIHFT